MTLATSDPAATLNTGAPERAFAHKSETWCPLPENDQGADMAGTGRPRAIESQRRRHQFLRLLANGATWREAAREARIKPDAVLTMLDQPEFRTVVAALLDGRAENVAVTVAPDGDRLAA